MHRRTILESPISEKLILVLRFVNKRKMPPLVSGSAIGLGGVRIMKRSLRMLIGRQKIGKPLALGRRKFPTGFHTSYPLFTPREQASNSRKSICSPQSLFSRRSVGGIRKYEVEPPCNTSAKGHPSESHGSIDVAVQPRRSRCTYFPSTRNNKNTDQTRDHHRRGKPNLRSYLRHLRSEGRRDGGQSSLEGNCQRRRHSRSQLWGRHAVFRGRYGYLSGFTTKPFDLQHTPAAACGWPGKTVYRQSSRCHGQ